MNEEVVAMKTSLCMVIVLLLLSATIMACANRILRLWLMMGYRGGGIMMGVFLIIVILTGCTPY
jgi:hypothetical protein